MISFRYHLISLSAVLLALAAGVLLGAGVLQDDVVASPATADKTSISPSLAGYDAGYAAVTAPPLLKDTLKGRTVLIVTTPGARESEVEGLVENLGRSGAKLAGEIALTDKALTPGNRQFFEGVARQAYPSGASTTDPWATIGAALTRAYVTTADGALDDAARTIRAALTEGDLVVSTQEPSVRAELVLVVSGPAATTDSGHGQVLTQILPALAAGSDGVLVAGPVASGEGGVVQDVRESEAASALSTFDVTDTATGRAGAVLALAKDASGHSGSWGTSRAADGPVPR